MGVSLPGAAALRDGLPSHAAGHRDPPTLTVQLLGRFQVTVGASPIPDELWRTKVRQLSALLALAPNYTLGRDEVLELLWPGRAPAAAALNPLNLRNTLYHARKILDGAAAPLSRSLRRQADRLVLRPPGHLRIDVVQFEVAAATARQASDPATYEAALALYGGELLPDDRYEDWAARRREGLRETQLALLMGAARPYIEQGARPNAIAALERVVEIEPTFAVRQPRGAPAGAPSANRGGRPASAAPRTSKHAPPQHRGSSDLLVKWGPEEGWRP